MLTAVLQTSIFLATHPHKGFHMLDRRSPAAAQIKCSIRIRQGMSRMQERQQAVLGDPGFEMSTGASSPLGCRMAACTLSRAPTTTITTCR